MNRDYYNDIRYYLNMFNCIIRRKKLSQGDIEHLILLLEEIQIILNYYIEDFFDDEYFNF